MKAYQTDVNGVYVGEASVQKHPFKDEFLLPAGATWLSPPTDEIGKWQLVEDQWKSFEQPKQAKDELDPILEKLKADKKLSNKELQRLLKRVIFNI